MTATATAHARRHPMTVITRARELTEAGYSAARVVRTLEADGVIVSRSSVNRWTTARGARKWQQANKRRAAAQATKNGSTGMGDPRSRPEFKLARIRALSEIACLKDAQIARVMAFDFNEPITRAMVRYALRTGRYPRTLT